MMKESNGDVVETFHFIRNRLVALTDGEKATFGFAPANTVISTYAYFLDGVMLSGQVFD